MVPRNSEYLHIRRTMANKHLLDLRLIHHYTAYTVEAFVGTGVSMEVGDLINILKNRLPQAPLHHEFLVDAILYVAMIHLSSIDNTTVGSLPIYKYRDRALRSLRQSRLSLTRRPRRFAPQEQQLSFSLAGSQISKAYG